MVTNELYPHFHTRRTTIYENKILRLSILQKNTKNENEEIISQLEKNNIYIDKIKFANKISIYELSLWKKGQTSKKEIFFMGHRMILGNCKKYDYSGLSFNDFLNNS